MKSHSVFRATTALESSWIFLSPYAHNSGVKLTSCRLDILGIGRGIIRDFIIFSAVISQVIVIIQWQLCITILNVLFIIRGLLGIFSIFLTVRCNWVGSICVTRSNIGWSDGCIRFYCATFVISSWFSVVNKFFIWDQGSWWFAGTFWPCFFGPRRLCCYWHFITRLGIVSCI